MNCGPVAIGKMRMIFKSMNSLNLMTKNFHQKNSIQVSVSVLTIMLWSQV